MPAEKSQLSSGARALYRVGNVFARLGVSLLMALPYGARVATAGWVTTHVLAPLAGFHRRTRKNLGLIFPDLPSDEVRTICIQVADNAARTAMEQLSPQEFLTRTGDSPVSGPGLAAIEAARAKGRPVIICSAHFGNYAAMRAWFLQRGYQMGALYRRLANPYFNDFYVGKLEALGRPCFEQGLQGMRKITKHLRSGGMLGVLTDLHVHGGEAITFLGKPAVTSLSTADLALRFNALLVPGYAIRQPDGLSFRIELHLPIPHTDVRTMTQAMHDDLGDMVRAHMGQWFWIHRRWKPWVKDGVYLGLPDG